jgi:hypothetical protein
MKALMVPTIGGIAGGDWGYPNYCCKVQLIVSSALCDSNSGRTHNLNNQTQGHAQHWAIWERKHGRSIFRDVGETVKHQMVREAKRQPIAAISVGSRPRLASPSMLNSSTCTIHNNSQLARAMTLRQVGCHASPAPNSRSGRRTDRAIIPKTNSVT